MQIILLNRPVMATVAVVIFGARVAVTARGEAGGMTLIAIAFNRIIPGRSDFCGKKYHRDNQTNNQQP